MKGIKSRDNGEGGIDVKESGVKVDESRGSDAESLLAAVEGVLSRFGVTSFLLVAPMGEGVSAVATGCENCVIEALGVAFRSFPELRETVEGGLFLASTLEVVEKRMCVLH